MKSYTDKELDIYVYRFFKERLKQTNGFFVDVGANDGITGSNSLAFEEAGWKGLLVEANVAHKEALLKRKWKTEFVAVSDSASVKFSAVSGISNLHGLSRIDTSEKFYQLVKKNNGSVVEKEIPAKTLTCILDDNNVDKNFDVLSVDVEGHELVVLNSLDFNKYVPRVMLVEDNSKGEDSSVYKFICSKGYIRANRLGVNEIYVRNNLKNFFLIRRLKTEFTYARWATKRFVLSAIGKKARNPFV